MGMREHRQGTKRSDGRWRFRRRINGRKMTFIQRGGESRAQLAARIDRAHIAVHSGPKSRMRLSNAIDGYLKHREGADLADSTHRDDAFAGALLANALGSREVGDVNGVQADMALRRWDSKRRTKLKVRGFGSRLYRWMGAMGWTTSNPFRDSSPVGYSPGRWEEPMPAEDFERAIAFVEGNLQALLVTLRCTALRPLSIRGLTWFEVDDDGLARRPYAKYTASRATSGS